ncbi:MAG: C40 family peptidase [Bacteroidales bacterium]|nr:C40 family peptidase [Bacteroidales bacterium]
MKFGAVLLSVVPVRAEPSDRAEMVTQLLFGELVVIHQKYEQWINIRNVFDNYEGWVDSKQVEAIEEAEFNRLRSAKIRYISSPVDVIQNKTANQFLPVLAGSTLRNNGESSFEMAGMIFSFDGETKNPDQPAKYEDLLGTAMTFLNAPYLWGGKTVFGIDCSGFMQVVFMLSGIQLLRDASMQATSGETVNFMAEARPGDLVFFDNKEGEIVHAGMIIDNNEIIHASGRVRIDTIDHQGIYNRQLKKYTHNLRVIKRVL